MDEQNMQQDMVEFSPETDGTSIERCLTFESGNLVLYISTKYVIEIIDNHSITPLPLVPSYIKGIVNLRGRFCL